MKMKFAVLGLFLALSAPIQAQTGHAYVKFPQTKESLAQAIEKGRDGDGKVLNISVMDFVRVMNEGFNLRLENREDLANHIRSLQPVSLPQGILIHLARLLGSKNDSKGWYRYAHPDEIGLMNRETGVVELSLDCANPIYGLVNQVNVVTAVHPDTVKAPVVVAPTPPPQVYVIRMAESPREPKPIQMVRKSHLERNWGWYTGLVTAIVGAAILNNNRHGFQVDNKNTVVISH